MKPETIGELNIMNQTLIEKIDAHIETSNLNYERMLDAISDLNKTCDLTLQQALKTNGRVNIIEPLAKDYGINRERIKGAVTFGAVVTSGVIALFFFTGKLYVDSKESRIIQNVSEAVYQKLLKEFEVTINK